MVWVQFLLGLFAGLGHQIGDDNTRLDALSIQSELPPDTVIVSPQGDVEITAGESVSFRGSTVGLALPGTTINWLVTGGVIPRFFRGENVTIPFLLQGRYEVFCAARNAARESDPTPDTRIVTVLPLTSVIETEIVVPERDLVVAGGSRVVFEAQGQPQNADFEWEISRSGATSSTHRQNGANIEIEFVNLGRYEVTCQAVTPLGLRDLTPARRIIDVVALDASIVYPPGRSVSVTPGTELSFQGTIVSAPAQNLATRWYLLDSPQDRIFGTSAVFVFPDPGTFSVIFEVEDDLGNTARDYRVIRVSESGTLGVEILSPDDGSAFSVGELLHLQGRVFGADQDDLRITWTLAGQVFSTLDVRDVTVNRPGRFNLKLVAGVPDQGPYASDQITIEIFDPERIARTEICRPLTDLTILPGDTVFFDGKRRNEFGTSDSGPYWSVTDANSGTVLLEAHRQTLGRVTFPEQEGDYIVSYSIAGPS